MLIDAPFNDITEKIIGSAIEVHRELGPGLLESSYFACLLVELEERKLRFEAERPLPIIYKGRSLDVSYRLDAIVENQVVLELKSVERLLGIHEAQVRTYRRLIRPGYAELGRKRN